MAVTKSAAGLAAHTRECEAMTAAEALTLILCFPLMALLLFALTVIEQRLPGQPPGQDEAARAAAGDDRGPADREVLTFGPGRSPGSNVSVVPSAVPSGVAAEPLPSGPPPSTLAALPSRGCVMVSYPDVEKLLTVHSPDPPVLSLYLQVPLNVPDLRGLPARAGELLSSAAAGLDGPEAARVLSGARQEVLRHLEAGGRNWLGHGVAMFSCRPAGLAEAFPLPGDVGELAVFADRPHVRPLLVTLQRHPAYHVAVVDRQHAWLFAVTGERIGTATTLAAAGVRSPHFGGWYGLESHRVNERIAQLARHHFSESAAILAQSLRAGDERLVVGGHAQTIPQFLAALPADVRDRVAGRFVVDTAVITPARVRALAEPVIQQSVAGSEQRLIATIRQQPPGGRAAIGLPACLAAARSHAVRILAVPDQGLEPGLACQRCGALGVTRPGCRCASPVRPVPDLIEELVVGVRHEGGTVQAVPAPPGGIAALLQAPVRSTGAARPARVPGAPGAVPGAVAVRPGA